MQVLLEILMPGDDLIFYDKNVERFILQIRLTSSFGERQRSPVHVRWIQTLHVE